LGQNLTLGHVGEFACATRALAPFTPTLVFSKMVNMLLALHLSDIESPCSDSLLDFQLDSNLELSTDPFKANFLHMFQLSVGGIFGMVFEHLRNSFDLEDLMSGFIKFQQLCSHVVVGYILGFMV